MPQPSSALPQRWVVHCTPLREIIYHLMINFNRSLMKVSGQKLACLAYIESRIGFWSNLYIFALLTLCTGWISHSGRTRRKHGSWFGWHQGHHRQWKAPKGELDWGCWVQGWYCEHKSPAKGKESQGLGKSYTVQPLSLHSTWLSLVKLAVYSARTMKAANCNPGSVKAKHNQT